MNGFFQEFPAIGVTLLLQSIIFTYLITSLIWHSRDSLAIFFIVCNPFNALLVGFYIGIFLKLNFLENIK